MSLPDPKEITKFIKIMRKEGVNHLKIGDFELSLDHAALFPKKPGKEIQTDIIPTQEYDEMATLLWSSAGIGEEQ